MSDLSTILLEILKLSIVGLIASYVTFYFNKRSEAERLRREWLAERLQESYSLVVESIEHPSMSDDDKFVQKKKLEEAINKVDLFANAATKAEVMRLIENYKRGEEWVVYTPLLTAIRNQHRELMNLPKLTDPVETILFAKKQ